MIDSDANSIIRGLSLPIISLMGCNNSKSNVVGPKAYKNAEPASQAVVTAEPTVAQPAPEPTP